MPPFPVPGFSFDYQVDEEIAALRHWRDTQPDRAIPTKTPGRLLLATWNLANLGLQQRTDSDYQLIAEILSWFDLIAIQEVNDDLTGVRAIHTHLPASWRLLFSDAAGNHERLTFVYDTTRLTVGEEIGEVTPFPDEYRRITLPGITQHFDGFDRPPYLATFTADTLTCSLVNVHLYFGSDTTRSRNRRSLEAYAVGRWADLRRRDRHALTHKVIALGDFNLPKAQPGDPIFDALTARGLTLPPHSTRIASAIATDAQYDQVAFFPGESANDFTGQAGVFDFDGAVFAQLWRTHPREDFLAYVRYHLSDHRPLWTQLQT
jgi:endonuclease/exonuclease/phosphatase family metal-dependent hydrolase